jgi:excisionase family DNA binding protein
MNQIKEELNMLAQYQDIMTTYEVTEALCIGKNRVYELLGNGSLKGFRIGNIWKIPKEAVIEYIMTQSGLK